MALEPDIQNVTRGDSTSRHSGPTDRPPVLAALPVDVIHSQELESSLPAALTGATILANNEFSELPPPLPTGTPTRLRIGPTLLPLAGNNSGLLLIGHVVPTGSASAHIISINVNRRIINA